MDLQKSFALIIDEHRLDRLKAASNVNVEISTMGGKMFWDQLAEHKNWRLQENKLTKLKRVLDPNDCRFAWGKKLDEIIINIAEDCMIDKRF